MAKVVKQRQAIRMNVKRESDKVSPRLTDVQTNKSNIAVSLQKLKGYADRLTTLNEKCLEIVDGEEVDSEIDTANSHDEELAELIARIEVKLHDCESETTKSKVSDENPSNTDNKVQSTVKLPKLEISKFSGDPLRWKEFWDGFASTIDSNKMLSDVDKQKYLRSFLQGEALRVIEGFTLTAQNYTAIKDTLQERFGNSQLVIFSHITALLELPVATHDLGKLQEVYDGCERHIRSLVALGLSEDTFGQMFTPMILQKLPTFVKMELNRRNGSQLWTLANLRLYLKEEIRARDMSQRQFGESPQHAAKREQTKGKPFRHKPPPKEQGESTVSTMLPVTSKGKKDSCHYCKQQHKSDTCQEYPDYKSRREAVKDRCLKCLGSAHRLTECRSKGNCSHCKKSGHHSSLCYRLFKGAAEAKRRPLNPEASAFTPVTNVTSHGIDSAKLSMITNMQTAVAPISNTNGQYPPVRVRLLFDTAGFRSYITARARRMIGSPTIDHEDVSLSVFEDKKRKNRRYDVTTFDVILPDGSKQRVIANVTDSITCPVHKEPLDLGKYGLILPLAEPMSKESESVEIDVLIAGDHYYDFVTGEQIRCSDGPVFVASSLGYLTSGVIRRHRPPVPQPTLFFSNSPALDNNCDIERLWRLEDVGVRDPPDSYGDEEALARFGKTLRFEEGRFSVTWPWTSNNPELPDNKALSLGRLKSLLKRLRQLDNGELLQKYDETFRDQERKGIIEPAPEPPTGKLVHYLPHHAVLTPQKTTTKLRIVFDASAKLSGKHNSLNDCLHRGPVLLSDLGGLLLRFRIHKFSFVADVEKAFLQVSVQEKERDVTRFMWLKDLSKPALPTNIQVYRFRRVAFGLICSSFLLMAVVCHFLTQSGTQVAMDVKRNIYVDNVISGCDDDNEMVAYYREAKALFSQASMNLREWYSNCNELQLTLPSSDHGQAKFTKVLGLTWDTFADTLQCSIDVTGFSTVRTKRQVLKSLARMYDPIGLFSPISLAVRMLMQQLWVRKVSLDDDLPQDLLQQWHELRPSLEAIASRQLPRRIIRGSRLGSRFQLHCFCDASEKAYATAAYLREETSDGSISCHLVFSRSRVSPLKPKLTIPRLELMGVLIGARLVRFIRKELDIISLSGVYLWTDSMCILQWLKSNKIQTVFVENRLKEIRSLSTDVTLRHVPSKDNPADIASRGSSFDVLVDNKLWWHGPEWLLDQFEMWPSIPDDLVTSFNSPEHYLPIHVVVSQNSQTSSLSGLLNISTFSSMLRLIRVVAWIFRFARNCRSTVKDRCELTAAELNGAKMWIDKQVQSDSFPEILANSKAVQLERLTKDLGLFIDPDGLIRCKGRLINAGLSQDATFPKLMPKNHFYSRLLIKECHERLFHAGVSHTLSELRQEYWVLQARTQVKQAVFACNLCRKIRATPFKLPPVPPLPVSRVAGNEVFQTTGIDYLGPLLIRELDGNLKVWICLFTCALVRAIHLEVVTSLDTEQFLLALRRFGAIYGFPTLIVCDNAKNFHASRDCMKSIVLQQPIQQESAKRGIEWKFIVEKSPWMGGFYERLVALVKRALRRSLDSKKVTLVELQTLSYEISTILNTRPIVYVEDDVRSQALCPANFFLKAQPQRMAVVRSESSDVSDSHSLTPSDRLLLKWQRLQHIIDEFWKTWQKQYLSSLRERSSFHNNYNRSSLDPSVGMTVIVQDESTRSKWHMGRITELLLSRDGVCRAATVLMPNGKHINRPLKLLCPLERSVESVIKQVEQPRESTGITQRLPRAAALKAKHLISAISAEEADADM